MEEQLLAQHYILLNVDGIQLCFPKQDGIVVDLASVVQEQTDGDSCSVGVVVRGQKKWPAYSIDKEFRLLPSKLDQQKFCVNFALNEQRPFAILCNEVTNIKSIDAITPNKIPNCMQTPLSPVTQLFRYNGELVFILNQTKMINYITNMEHNHG